MSKVVGASRLLRGKYDLRERAKMVGGVVKRSAVRRTSVSEMASKIKTPYMAGPLLQRTSPRPAERMSPKESPKGRGPEARKLMDKLADEIQDSLTKLFNKKQGPPSPSQPRPAPLTRLERRPPVGKHPAVSIWNILNVKCISIF